MLAALDAVDGKLTACVRQARKPISVARVVSRRATSHGGLARAQFIGRIQAQTRALGAVALIARDFGFRGCDRRSVGGVLIASAHEWRAIER